MTDLSLDLTALLQAAEDAFDRGDFAAAMESCDRVLAEAARGSDEARRAEEQRRHAEAHSLLEKIAAATDASTALELLRQAGEKGLVYDLNRQSLEAVRQAWQGVQRDAVDGRLTALMGEGQALAGLGEWQAAAERYAQAAGVAGASEALIDRARARQREAEAALKHQTEYAELVNLARKRQAEGEYDDAIQAVLGALRLQPGSTEASHFHRELEAQAQRARQLARLSAEAERAQAAGNLPEAEAKLKAAVEIAGELRLAHESAWLAQALAGVGESLSKRAAQAQARMAQGREALNAGNLPEAVQDLEAARGMAPWDPTIANLLAEARGRESAAQAVSRVAEEIAHIPNLHNRLARLLEALRQAPGGENPELEELIERTKEELSEEARRLAIAATQAEGDLGLDTPVEVEDGKRDGSGQVLVRGIAQFREAIGLDRAAEIGDAFRLVFARIATRKLDLFVNRHAEPLIRRGKFAEAIQQYNQAIEMWNVAWLLTPTITWERMDDRDEPIVEARRRRSLDARLKIVAAQRDLAAAALEVAPDIQRRQLAGEAAQGGGRFDAACASYEQALQDIAAQDKPTQHVLSGLRQAIERRLSETLRGWAQQLSAEVGACLIEAERLGDLDQLGEAFDAAHRAVQGAREIERMRARYDQVTPEAQRTAWTAEGYHEQAGRVYDRIKGYRDDRAALDAGASAMADGDFTTAEDHLKRVARLGADEASQRLAKLPRLRELQARARQAEKERRYEAAVTGLDDAIDLDGQARWAVDLRKKILPLWEAQRDAGTHLERARAAMAPPRRNFEQALKHIDTALSLSPGDPDALELQKKAQAGQDTHQTAEDARPKMVEAFNRGGDQADYEEVVALAELVLADDPEHRMATGYKQRAEAILELDVQIREKMEQLEWADALSLVAQAQARYHRASNHLANLQSEIQQKLMAQQRYDDLLAEAEAALEEKAWGEVLAKALAASRQRPDQTRPRDLARQARTELLQIIRDRLNPRRPIEPPALADAEEAAQAIRQAEGDYAEGRERDPAGEETLAGVAQLLQRAQKLVLARQRLSAGDAEGAEALLRPLADARPSDAMLAVEYKRARFEALMKRARAAASPPPRWKDAVEHLQEALGLQAADGEAQRLLREARLERGLQLCEEYLRGGKLPDEARSALLGLDPDHPRVKAVRERLGVIEDKLRETGDRLEAQDLETAVEAVDTILAQRATYRPAVEKRKAILDDALRRALKAEEDGDLGQAEKWYRLARDKGLDEVRNRGREGVGRIGQELDSRLDQLIDRVDRALNNPDLTEADRSALEVELKAMVAIAPDRRPETVRVKLEAIQNRKGLISKVEAHLEKAEQFLIAITGAANAMVVDQYLAQARGELENARGVTHFAGRSRCSELNLQVSDHRGKYQAVQQKTQAYQEALNALAQPVEFTPPITADTVTDKRVSEVVEAGERLLEAAIKLNQEIAGLDPENLYRLRVWPDRSKPEQEPLQVELRELERKKSELGQVGNALQEALGLRDSGAAKAQAARPAQAEADDDKKLEEAAAAWDKAAGEIARAATQLKKIKAPVAPLPHTKLLYDLVKPLLSECAATESEARGNATKLKETLDEIGPYRENANSNWLDNELSPRLGTIDSLLSLYEEILKRNPIDGKAKERMRVLKAKRSEIAAANNRWRRFWIAAGVGVPLIGLLVAAGVLFFAPGGTYNPFTPTPTLTATHTRTLAPSSTPLPPSPTHTPPPTATAPATFTPPPTPTPQACVLENSGWIREGPSDSTVGLANLRAGSQVQIVDARTGDDGALWYEVVNPGGNPPTGFINPRLFPATCSVP